MGFEGVLSLHALLSIVHGRLVDKHHVAYCQQHV